MAQRAALPADVNKHAVSLARAMTIALRSWAFYPPEHPAVALAVDRLVAVGTEVSAGGPLQLAVTPHALLVDGLPLESGDLVVTECAELLHDRDILQITVVGAPADQAVRALQTELSLDREVRRARGGPAALWAEADHHTILVEQIDYQELLEREFDEGPARRDGIWKSIVRSMLMGRKTFTVEEQQRLLEISKDVGAIGELCKDTKEQFCTPEGSPMVTTQAATVLAVYRHIAKTVAALEPERAQDVMNSLALAAGSLEPGTALELMLQDEQQDDGGPSIGAALKQAFDDQQVALLLARALSSPGQTTNRLAQVLDTLAPDEQRRARVLTLAKKLITERDFGSKRPIDDIRKSLDELLLKYDESSYVSLDYRQSMDQATSRAAELAARGLPPELDEWLETLGHDSVRRLSGQLLIDLLRNETVPGRQAETARDMAAFVEELLLAGVYGECVPVIQELVAATTRVPAIAPDACRKAVETVGASAALAEAAGTLGDQSAEEYTAFAKLIKVLGPSTVAAVIAAYQGEDGLATERATALLVKLGPPAIPQLGAALDDKRWFVQREIAKALGTIGTAAAVAPLQTLLRRTDLRVLRTAVASLAAIDDASAVRALHTVLKATSGEARAAVISALVGLKDPRVVPILTRILQDSNPFGPDNPLVHETLNALATLRDERAIAPITALARRRRWLSWGATARLRDASLRALKRIGTEKAKAALADLATTGDFFLKRQAARLAREQA